MMTLQELIDYLAACDPSTRVPIGFARPHSYRGYYYDLAFEIETETTVGAMLAAARKALGATYQGWKGGEYTMGEHTDVWLVEREGDLGETIGPVLLAYMVGTTATDRKTPDEWLQTDEFSGITVMDPDGWDRFNADGPDGWNTPLTRDEFKRRLARSTIGPRIG